MPILSSARTVALALACVCLAFGSASGQTLNKTSLSLGNVAIGSTSAAKTVTFKNTLATPVVLSAVSVSGANGGDFTASGCALPAALAPNQSCVYSVRLTPSALGARTASLTFTHDGPASLSPVTLSGTGVQPVTLSPASLSFGTVALGMTGAPRTATLRNVQAAPLSIASISVTTGFVRTGGTCPAGPSTLGAGASCTIAVAFAPPASGPATGSLTVTHSASNSPQTVALSGTGSAPVTVSPASLSFSSTVAGAVSATKNVTVTNRKTTTLTISSVVISSHFSIASNTCAATLTPGANCVVGVRFQPTAVAALTGSLTFTDDAVTSPQVVSLSGTATSPLTSTPTSLTFASQAVGTTSAAQNVTVRNRTTAPLTIGPSSASGDFAVSATTCGVLAANATCTVSVRLSPTAVGALSGTLSIPYATAPGSPLTLALAGTGTGILQSIAVTPVAPSIVEGDSLPFTATGTYSGGAQVDVTSSVVWASGTPAVAAISNAGGSKGVATALTEGQTNISATLGAISGSTLLTVTPLRQLLSIDVTPIDPVVLSGATTQLTATGHYSDGTTENVTAVADWSSTTPSVASVSNGAGSKGLVSALAVGNATIQATVDAVSGSTLVTVAPPLEVTTTWPLAGDIAVPQNNGFFSVTFNRAINAATLTTNTADTSCSGSFQVSSDDFATCVRMTSAPAPGAANQYFVLHAQPLPGLTTFRIRVTTAAQDTNGVALPVAFTSGGFTTEAAGLLFLSMSPENPTVGLGTTVQMTATAHFSDGSTVNISGQVVWSIDATPVAATVSPAGLVRVLATGPYSVTASLPNQDFATTTISGVAPALEHQSGRTTTKLLDGRVLIAGGSTAGDVTAGAELFDPSTGLFTATGSMGEARTLHTATLLPDGRVLVVGGRGSSFQSLVSAEIYNPTTGAWTPTAPMQAGRWMHSATLSGSRVIVLYGLISGGIAAPDNPEIFDATSETWTFAAPLGGPRWGHTVTTLANGQLLLAGGTGQFGSFNDFKRVDPTTVSEVTGGNLATGARSFHTATLLADGRVLIVGGTEDGSTALDTAELFDVSTNQWTATGPLPFGRQRHTATMQADGRVLIAGGPLGLKSAVQYELASGSFLPAPDLALAREDHTATLLDSGEVFLLGGTLYPAAAEVRVPSVTMVSFEIQPSSQTLTLGDNANYQALATFSDGTTGLVSSSVTWSSTPGDVGWAFDGGGFFSTGVGSATILASSGLSSATATATVEQFAPTIVDGQPVTGLFHIRRSGMTATRLMDGRVLVAGGVDPAGNTATAELYDPVSGLFTPTGPMTTGRSLHTATLLPDGKVLVIGGRGPDGGPLASTELYDPATGTWAAAAPMQLPRWLHTATLAGTRVIVLYGATFGSTFVDLPEIFDSAAGTWTYTDPLGGPRIGHTVTVLANGDLLVFGGSGTFGFLGDHKRVDPVTVHEYTGGSHRDRARAFHTSTLLADGRILVAGGTKDGFAPTASALLYDPSTDTWSATANLPAAVQRHTATLMPDNRVLVAGGNSPTGRTASLYEPASGSFLLTPQLAFEREDHAAVLLESGAVLLVGGVASPHTAEVRAPGVGLVALNVQPASPNVQLATTQHFTATATFSDGSSADVTTAVTWSVAPQAVAQSQGNGAVLATGVGSAVVTAASGAVSGTALLTVEQSGTTSVNGFPVTGLTHARPFGATSTRLQDGRVLIVGGHDGGSATAAAEIYDPSSGLFVPIDAMAVARYEHTATLLPDGRVLVVGGFGVNNVALASAELFDPATLSWTAATPPALQRVRHTATLVDNTVVILYGQTGGVVTDVPETYDVATDTWSNLGPMFGGRFGHTTTLLPDGTLLIAGGYSNSGQAMSDVKRYDPVTGGQQGANQLLSPRAYHTATLLPDGRVLLTGGDAALNSYTATAEIYDPQTNQWTATGSLPQAAYQHTATLLANGKVLVAGGTSPDGRGAAAYTPASGTFDPVAQLAYGRQRHTATLLDDGAVLFAGGLWSPALAEVRPPDLTIAALEVVPATHSVGVGQTAAYQATATFSDASSADVTHVVSWTVSPGGIAAATTTPGVFRAITEGEATITATSGAVTASGTLTVGTVFAVTAVQPNDGLTGVPRNTAIDVTFSAPINVATLTVNTADASCITGSLQVSSDDFATCVRMSSAPVEVGTNTYRVQPAETLLGLRTYKVRVTTALQDATGGALAGTFTSGGFATAPAGLLSLEVTPLSSTIGLGKTVQLTATGIFDDGTTNDVTALAEWRSARPEAGSVSETGLARLLATSGMGIVVSFAGVDAFASITGVSPATWRAQAAAVRLLDGRVLIAGGMHPYEGTPFASAELFDPSTGTFSATGTMSVVRSGHALTLLSNGLVLVTGGFDGQAGTYAAVTEIYDPATGVWTPSMPIEARAYHTATRLADGRVLVVGGHAEAGALASAEVFDPVAGGWSATPPVAAVRGYHTATLLPDGRVLVTGGVGSSYLNSAELFDPAANSWTATGWMSLERYRHTATLVNATTVLVVGGYGGDAAQAAADLYDVTTGTWTQAASLPNGVWAHTATLLANGDVLVAGGVNDSAPTNITTARYDVASAAFQPTPNLADSRRFHTATLLDSGTVLLVGGDGQQSAELIDGNVEAVSLAVTPGTISRVLGSQDDDPFVTATATFSDGTTLDVTSSVTWNVSPANIAAIESFAPGQLRTAGIGTATITATMGNLTDTTSLTVTQQPTTVVNGQTVTALTHLRQQDMAIVTLADGRVLITGGYDGAVGPTPTAELFDPLTGTFVAAAPMSAIRQMHTATLLADGRVLVAGGAYNGWLSTAEIFDPATGVWTPVADMNAARAGHVAALVGTRVLVAGGDVDNGSVTAELFDPATGVWTPTGSLSEAANQSTAVVLPDGRVMLVGGLAGFSLRTTAEIYDPAAGTWMTANSPASLRYQHTLTLLPPNRMLMAGGANFGGGLKSAEIYDIGSGAWSPTGDMPRAIQSHTATLLSSGQVLIAGGFASVGHSRDTSVYDPVTGVFTIGPPLAIERTGHVAISLNDGRVMLAGGGGGGSATAELRNVSATLTSLSVTPASRSLALDQGPGLFQATATFSDGTTADVTQSVTWTSSEPSVARVFVGQAHVNAVGHATLTAFSGLIADTAELDVVPVAPFSASGGQVIGLTHIRSEGMTLTRLLDGRVLVTGGRDAQAITASVEIYDPQTGVFAAGSAMASPRSYHTATRLADGRVLVAGGYSVAFSGHLASAEIFDPVAGTWAVVGSMSRVRASHTATLVGTKVLVAGGDDISNLRGAELFDPATGTWSPVGNLITGRYRHTATLLPDGRVLVAGGAGVATAELYNPATGIWSASGSLSSPRQDHTATLLVSNQVMVAGGRNGFSTVSSKQIYDIATGMWSASSGLPQSVDKHTATLRLTGAVVFTGGLGGSGSHQVMNYNPGTGIVSFTSPALAYGRFGHLATLLHDGLPDSVLLVGGIGARADGSGQSASAATAELLFYSDTPMLALSVTPTSPNVSVGSALAFQATATFPGGITRNVTNLVNWTVHDPAVATVVGPGTVRGDTVGTTTVTATFGIVSDGVILAVN